MLGKLVVAALGLGAVMVLGGCGGAVAKEFRPQGPVTQFRNDDWRKVLDVVATSDGMVRYDALKANTNGCRDALFRYVGLLGEVSPDNRPELFPTANDKLAYWINAYNAVCMYRVVDRGYPGNHAASIPPFAIYFTDSTPLGGDKMSLDSLEKSKICSTGDPRIHFALNCMSYSCPPLRNEPFEGAKLDTQMDEQGRKYLSDPRGAVRDGDGVKLSEIFTNFYKSDFTSAYEKKTGKSDAGLLEALRPFAAPDSPVINAKSYSSMSYNWSLNKAN